MNINKKRDGVLAALTIVLCIAVFGVSGCGLQKKDIEEVVEADTTVVSSEEIIVEDTGENLIEESIVTDTIVEEQPIKDPSEDPILPLNYRGNFSDYINLDDYTVIQNEYIKIFILKEYDYSPDIEKTIMQSVEWVEKYTGLNTLTQENSQTKSAPILRPARLDEMDIDLQQVNLFTELGNYDNKLIIFPVTYQAAVPAADSDNCIQLPTRFYLIDSYDSYEFGVLLHELTHIAQGKYCQSYVGCYPIVEGFAVWATSKAAKEQGLDELYKINIGEHKTDSLPADVEAYFAGDWVKDTGTYGGVRNYNPYNYGYAFCLYLENIYGLDIFEKIFEEGSKIQYEYSWDEAISAEKNDRARSELFTKAIKKLTSESVFIDFAEWFDDNKDTMYN